MTDDIIIANENISLSSLTRDPVRKQADRVLAMTLHDLECEGIPPSMLADLLFEYLMIEMEPDHPIASQEATVWFAQLHRFRDTLQQKLDAIHQIYDAPSS